MKKILVIVLLCSDILLNGQVTVENLLSPPFPASLVASPDGNRIAWVFNSRGERNIFVAEAPLFNERKLTGYKDDEGQEISDLTFTPDNSKIVFIRGGNPNANGESPNPARIQSDVERSIWVINFEGSGLRRISPGRYPKISPDGRRLAFILSGQVWMASLDSIKEPEKLFQLRGSQSSIRWSPDGNRLAFVSNRSDHSFIGVFETRKKEITFFDASTNNDNYPAWSPDGKFISFVRSAGEPEYGKPWREGNPWSIRKAEISTGKSVEIWRSENGPGSIINDNTLINDNYICWINDRIIFPWERNGWQHLYSVSVNDGSIKPITKGEGEVETVKISRDGKSLIIGSNIGDTERRHLFRVNAITGELEEITTGDGIEWNAVETSRGIVCIRSEATLPARIVVVNGKDQFQPLASSHFPEEFPKDLLVVPEKVIIKATDGMKVSCQVFIPKNLKKGEKHPALIFVHGGPQRQMLLGFNYMPYYHNAYALNQYFAINGFIVLSVNYRLGTGYGLEFREPFDAGASGASEYRDIEGAGLYLAGRDDVDPARIGVWGGSYGGYLTAMALAKSSNLFACGVDLHGVSDWSAFMADELSGFSAEKKEVFRQKALQSSPVNFLETWESPVLLIHGDDDSNVPFSQTVNLADSLRSHGVGFEQLILPDEVHFFLLYRTWVATYNATIEFFNRKLKK